MLPTFISNWKTMLIGIATIVASITPTPALSGQSLNPNAPNVGGSQGTSRNWSGYAVTKGEYTTITGSWTIPYVAGGGHTAADATWIGIGGITSSDLIQVGTQNIMSSNGQVVTSAFFELLPNEQQSVPITVNQGDSMTGSLTQQETNQWQIVLKDITNGNTYNTTVTYASSFSSAEWIEEAPSNLRSILPLDNFGSVSFSNGETTQNSTIVNLFQSNAQQISMSNNAGQTLANPSSLGTDGASFTVTRTNVTSNAPVPQFDRNPGGFRRHGLGIGGFNPLPRSYQGIVPTLTITPIPNNGSFPSMPILRRRFRIFRRGL